MLKQLGQLFDIQYVEFTDTVMSEGLSQWIKKLMQTGGVCCGITHQLFTDLSLSEVEIQKRTRRTNKYNISKGNEDYEVNVYDENTTNLPTYFSDFHKFHASVAGRETRNQLTWDIQLQGIEYGSDTVGRSFLIFIRDKQTKELAGAALFDTTFTHGLYCVAAYDRSRFSKPVGHVIQAYAMGKMRSLGIRWYEIGERPYITDRNSNQKIVDIGHYKEGFATHTFLKIYIGLSLQNSSLN